MEAITQCTLAGVAQLINIVAKLLVFVALLSLATLLTVAMMGLLTASARAGLPAGGGPTNVLSGIESGEVLIGPTLPSHFASGMRCKGQGRESLRPRLPLQPRPDILPSQIWG